MLNSLLDLSKIESGNALSAPTKVDIGALLDSVITLFREEANSRALRLCIRRPKRRIDVMGDPLLVRQSLINLIQNALRYTLQGGVLVAIRPRGDECMVEVWDTGVGIADEEKGKIFSPYYRPELAWKIDSAGHGLGLAVVARCAKLMKVKYGMQSIEGKAPASGCALPNMLAKTSRRTSRPPLTTPPRRYAMRRCLVPAWSSMTTRW